MAGRHGGYIIIVDPENGTREFDTITCFHCQALVHYGRHSEFTERTGGCRLCGKVICIPCVDQGSCTPWWDQMTKAENQARFRREAGLN